MRKGVKSSCVKARARARACARVRVCVTVLGGYPCIGVCVRTSVPMDTHVKLRVTVPMDTHVTGTK